MSARTVPPRMSGFHFRSPSRRGIAAGKSVAIVWLCSMAGCILLAGCSRNPQVALKKHLDRGNSYFEAAKYREAAIEYRNAIQIDPKLAQAHYSLAECYLRESNWPGAYQELSSTVQLQNNWKAHMELANLDLAGGRFLEARSSAQTVLEGDRQNAAAQVLLSRADAGLKNFKNAVPEAQRAVEMNPNLVASYLNLGEIEERNQNNPAAESNFRKASLRDPKSLPAMLALGNLYSRERRWREAERQFQAAVASDPQNPMARAGLAQNYLLEGRKESAEQALKDGEKVLKDTRTSYRMLADYYLAVGENDQALAEVGSLYSKYPTDLAAGKTYVQLLILQNRLGEAARINDANLKSFPSDTDSSILRGQILIRQGKAPEAIPLLATTVVNAPNSAAAHYYLGLAHAEAGDLGQAESEWDTAAKLQPGMADSQRALAQLAIGKNDPGLLMRSARQLTGIEPHSPDGYVYRATALLMRKNQLGAEADLKKAIEVAPQSPTGYARTGDLRVAQKRYDEAEKLYLHALSLSPSAYDALAGLTNIDVLRRQPEKALRRVEEQITRAPDNSNFYALLGQMELKNQDPDKAQTTFEKAVALDKHNVPALLLLANLLVSRDRIDQAIGRYNQGLKDNANDIRLYMALGSLLETAHRWQQAEDCYKKALGIHPDHALAANNLAYLMLEHGEDANAAFSLAQTAREGLPDSPGTADTFGWAYYQRGFYKDAIGLFQKAIKQNPKNATYHYHLGMAYQKANSRALGRKELQLALKIDPNYVQAGQIRKILAQDPRRTPK
jgi:tetratricopeptide (TPR) repeat protein